MAQAETTPVPIPLTTGQAADDVTQLATERALSRSGGGMGIMNEFHRAQQEAIGANIPAMRERIAAGFPVVERGQGGRSSPAAPISSTMRRRRAAVLIYGSRAPDAADPACGPPLRYGQARRYRPPHRIAPGREHARPPRRSAAVRIPAHDAERMGCDGGGNPGAGERR